MSSHTRSHVEVGNAANACWKSNVVRALRVMDARVAVCHDYLADGVEQPAALLKRAWVEALQYVGSTPWARCQMPDFGLSR